MRRAIWILWPSFVVAGVAEAIFFTLFDPPDLTIFGEPLGHSRMAVYTLSFFVFWLFAAASSAFTCFLQRDASEINRAYLPEGGERPPASPRSSESESGPESPRR